LRGRARTLRAWISQIFEGQEASDIIFVAHSMGAALARQAWLNAVDEKQGGDYVQSEWGARVRRFILFAGVNRGVDMERSFAKRWSRRLWTSLPVHLMVEDLLRGSAFLTNLRISWIRFIAALPVQQRPVLVQILAAEDSLVDRGDCRDMTVFQRSLTFEISGSRHVDPHLLRTEQQRVERLPTFAAAFTRQPSDQAPGETQKEEDVLMIVHGIRASRRDDWVSAAARRAREVCPGIVTTSPTYGYLSALRFALPWIRRKYSRFFRDFYTETLAKHPLGRFKILCHSNGTYLLGRSLRDFEAIRVDRVALAGSVLPANYDWAGLIASNRVKAVRSDGGARDWPVGLLCSALQGLGMRDVGTGGYTGFLSDQVTDVRFHPGGHGSMLEESNVDSMLRFLADPNMQCPELKADPMPFGPWSRAMKYLAPALVALIAGAVIACVVFSYWKTLIGLAAVLILLIVILDVI
jgi:alpha-beta hydrolase superfamily lysophospholipase